MKRALIYLSFFAAILFCGGASAQTGPTLAFPKLDRSLNQLHRQYDTHRVAKSSAAFGVDDPLIRLVGDYVIVDAVADGDAEALKANLEQLGMQRAVAFGRMVSGLLPVSALPQAAALATLRFVRTAAAMTHVGTVTSQGDISQRSHIARATFSRDGAGVTVGVLSNSYNCLGGAPGDVATGDLPNGVTVLQEISTCSGASDEGRAMAQIVHDVAPGAGLSFASAFNGIASFASNIIALKTNGAHVIVDDAFYFAEPMFQDGIIAQAVDTVVAGGAAYFSAAGNEGRAAYQSAFANSGVNLGTGGTGQIPDTPTFFAHDFNPGGAVNLFQTVTVPNGTSCFSFQWANPYFSVSGAPGAQTDLDVAIFDSAGNYLYGSYDRNVGNDPIEVDCFFNVGAPTQARIAIGKFAGPDPSLMKYVVFRSSFVINEFPTHSGTLFGHANAVGAEAVGAAAYNNTPAFGVSPPVLESYSSAGTTPILFDLSGNPINDPRATKPEIVAPDGADTTFFGVDSDANGFPNFFGTSAAAPHAAGVAALLLQAKPTLTPAQIYSALENTAVDMGTAGFDNDSGFGLIRADAALASITGDALDTILIPPIADGGVTNSTTAVFNFISNNPAATFACSLDAATFTACTSPKTYTRLRAGSHNFKVQAAAAGVTDTTPASFNWTVDNIAPDTTITVFPASLTNNPVATFQFTSTEAGATFQCSLDGGPFSACASPFVSAALLDGKHNFQVKAVDAAGNLDKSAAKAKSWSVDATRPVTTITGNPTDPTTITSATFRFASERKSTFLCRLDGGVWESCKSGKRYRGLAAGPHSFEVQATDAAGNIELAPASYTWTQN